MIAIFRNSFLEEFATVSTSLIGFLNKFDKNPFVLFTSCLMSVFFTASFTYFAVSTASFFISSAVFTVSFWFCSSIITIPSIKFTYIKLQKFNFVNKNIITIY